jgi:hypothetical protein
MALLIDHKVAGVLIVVGEFKRCERIRDVSFVTPQERPLLVKHAVEEAQKLGNQAFAKTWSDMEEDIINSIRSLKAERAEERQRIVKVCHIIKQFSTIILIQYADGEVALQDLDSIEGLEDLSGWEIPRVKFVEVKSGSSDWVLPPKENPRRLDLV